MKKVFVYVLFFVVLLLAVQVISPIEPAQPEVKTEANVSKTIHLNFVGDILAARAVEVTMRKKGYDYPFAQISQELRDADITFANLETPLTGTATSGKTTVGGTTVFRGDTDFGDALKRAGIDIVSIANNHAKDQGERGIRDTIQTLDTAGVLHVGAGMSLDEARRLQVVRVGDIRVGYLAYNDSDVVTPTTYANDMPQSGTNIMDVRRLIEDVDNARSQADILIVSMHSGTEYVTEKPNARQTAFARAAIDAGADMVIGHHPHVLQPLEIYKGKYILYSLGNFVFDQPWPDTKESALIRMGITLSRSDSGAWKISTYAPSILPLRIQNFQPQRVETEEGRRRVLERFTKVDQVLSIGGKNIFVELATSTESQAKGLSSRAGLPKETGLLFVFDGPQDAGIWMKDMKFPIDILWFDASMNLIDKRLSVATSTYPDVFYPKGKAQYVLETELGVLDNMSLTNGLTGELTLFDSYDKR